MIGLYTMTENHVVTDLKDPKFLQYYVREKFASISLQIFDGFKIKHHGSWSPASRGIVYSGKGYTHIVTGLQYGSLEIFKQIYNNSRNEPYLFIDAGYLLAKPHLTNIDTWRLRIVPNAYQMNWISKNQNDLKLLSLCVKGLYIRPRQPVHHGKCILLIPPSSEAVAQVFGLVNWEKETLETIHKYTKRQVIIRRKGDSTPLVSHLSHTHAVVSYTSNVSTDAVLNGVPAFCSKYAAAAPVCLHLEDLDRIETPYFPNEELRESWLISLANNQFSLAEIVSGSAMQDVIREMRTK